MAEVHTYDPNKVTVIVGGFPMTGYADGTFVEIEPMGDNATSQSGADGEVARAMGTDQRHSVKITLQQTSASNDILSSLRNLDRVSGGGAMFPVAITDLSGRTLFGASQGWIAKMPNMGFGKELTNREWMLHTGVPTVLHVGGNS